MEWPLKTCFVCMCSFCPVFVLFCEPLIFSLIVSFIAVSVLNVLPRCVYLFVLGQFSLACSPMRELILIISNCNLFLKPNHILCYPHHIPLGVRNEKWECGDDSDYVQHVKMVSQVSSVFRMQYTLKKVISSKQMKVYMWQGLDYHRKLLPVCQSLTVSKCRNCCKICQCTMTHSAQHNEISTTKWKQGSAQWKQVVTQRKQAITQWN